MLVILLLERWPMYDVDSRVVRVEVSGDEDVCGRLGRELGEDFGVRRGFLLAEEECGAGAVFVRVGGFVPFELVVVLLLVLAKVVFDF